MFKTFEIVIRQEGNETGESYFVKTDADKIQVQKAIDFVASTGKKEIEAVLIAIRLFGNKATQVKVEAEEVFDL